MKDQPIQMSHLDLVEGLEVAPGQPIWQSVFSFVKMKIVGPWVKPLEHVGLVLPKYLIFGAEV